MELRQLRYFVKAAETLSFSEAAKCTCVAQSTLSQQVKALEDELGVQLFHRTGHCISLTEPGAELLPHARRTLHDADACVSRVNDLRDMLTGTLNIGVTYSFSPILTETLLEFMKQYPGVRLHIHYRPMAELMEMLRRHEVDFVLAFRPIRNNEDIESHLLFDNHLAVIVNEYHPLAGQARITPAELSAYDLALPTRGLQARNAFDWHMERYPVPLNIRLELNEVNILLQLVRDSNLVTVLAEATLHNVSGFRAIPLDVTANEMDGCVHMLRGVYRKHSALRFIQMLRDSQAVRERVRAWFE